MKRYSTLIVLFLTAMMIATSCKKDEDKTPEPIPEPTPVEEEKDFQAVPLTITVSIAETSGSINGISLKQAFAKGDVIEITNPEVLYEPLTISADGSEGNSSADFTAELKVKKGAELVSGTTKLSAVLKNGNNYNNGKPLADVKLIAKPEDGIDQYCCWSCDGFTFSSGNNSVTLAPSTVFAEFNMFKDEVKMAIGNAEFSETISGSRFYAVPAGTKVEIPNEKFEMLLDGKEKNVYHLTAYAPDECIPHLFSIGEDKRVFFSKGNLQYRPLDGAWRLAPQQYHRCFEVKDDVGDNYADWKDENKWTDLFGPGMWIEGGNPCATEYDYTLPIDQNGELSTPCAYGAQWILLSRDEWDYLMEKRPDAAQKRGGAVVNGVEGWLILPDDWAAPDGFSFVTGFEENTENNQYTDDEWAAIEKAGAVFLPDAGQMCFAMIIGMSMTQYQLRTMTDNNVVSIIIMDDMNYWEATPAQFGSAVRLVQLQSGNTTIKVE